MNYGYIKKERTKQIQGQHMDKKKYRTFLILTSFFTILGLVGTVFSFACFIGGEKVTAVVARREGYAKKDVAVYEYSYEGQIYEKTQEISFNSKIKKGDKKSVYFMKSMPAAGFIMNEFGLFYFTFALSGWMTWVLVKIGDKSLDYDYKKRKEELKKELERRSLTS